MMHGHTYIKFVVLLTT